jgi:nucleoside 2-deoxyribosyltransferase
MKIYVAGSSREDQRYRIGYMIDSLIDAGHEVTSRWLDMVAVEQEQGFAANDLPAERGIHAVSSDLNDIRRADALVLMIPPPGVYTHGGFYEAGFADALGKQTYSCGVLGGSIFAYRTQHFESDYDLIEAMKAIGSDS